MSKDRLRVVAIRADVAGGFVGRRSACASAGRGNISGGIARPTARTTPWPFWSLPAVATSALASTDGLGYVEHPQLYRDPSVPSAERSDAVLSAVIWNAPARFKQWRWDLASREHLVLSGSGS